MRLVRSVRRTRTVSAVWREGRLQVSVPARLSRAEERRWIARMVQRSPAVPRRPDHHPAPPAPRDAVPPVPGGGADPALTARAEAIAAAHLDAAVPGGRLPRPVSVTWSTRQRQRWGSCTPADRSIRLSSRLRSMPEYVVDYVLVHELAHLLEPAHDAAFWALVERYPRAERALGYLEGVEARTGTGSGPE